MKSQNNIETELKEIRQLLTAQTDEPLNIDEACKYLSLSKSFVYKLTSKGQIPYFKPNNKKIYFKKSELNEWLFRNRINTDDELVIVAENYLNKKGV